MKAMLNPDVINGYIDFHKQQQLPFTMAISNYTTHIKSNYCDMYFMKTEQSNRVFSAYNKVKGDVLKKSIQPIDAKKLAYYSQSFKTDHFYNDIVFNVDLKSAYATVLLNEGLISKDTYSYLQRLPKMQRLAAVGMLAGKKNIFEINSQGKVISEKTVIAPTSDYFFFCVKKIAEVIYEAETFLGKSFLFSWVDGVYYYQDDISGAFKAGPILQQFFKQKGFESSFDVLEEFTVIAKPNYFDCSYRKEGKFKTMKVPRNDNEVAKQITNYLLTKKYK